MILSPEFEKARETAISYIGIDHSKSSGRVRQNLLKKGIAPEIADEVIDYYINLDYINDRRAAKRVALRYKGRRTRAQRMMVSIFIQNGIDMKIAKEMAENLEDDRDTGRILCESHFPHPSKDDEIAMLKLLARRGYPIGLSRDIVSECLK